MTHRMNIGIGVAGLVLAAVAASGTPALAATFTAGTTPTYTCDKVTLDEEENATGTGDCVAAKGAADKGEFGGAAVLVERAPAKAESAGTAGQAGRAAGPAEAAKAGKKVTCREGGEANLPRSVAGEDCLDGGR